MPREGQHIQGFYLVTVGRECGIFFSWWVSSLVTLIFYLLSWDRDDSHDRTNKVSGACHKRCGTWQEAIQRYRDAYNRGRVKALPEPNSQYWTTPVATVALRARVGRPSASSDELYWDKLEADGRELGVEELSAYLDSVTLQGW